MNYLNKWTSEFLDRHLPPHEKLYFETENKNILGFEFDISGIAVKLESGEEVYGSSSSFNNSSIQLAAYELLERYVGIKNLCNTEPGDTYFSFTNGMAIHQDSSKSKKNARLELIERNEIMKSWYFNTPIKKLDYNANLSFPNDFLEKYEVSIFDHSNIDGCFVVSIFAFPKNDSFNLIYSFGAAESLLEAVEKSKKEFLTRLGFLWEEKPHLENIQRNTSSYHQEYYLMSENWSELRKWLFENVHRKKKLSKYECQEIQFLDLTPNGWKDSTFVFKAIGKDYIPLFFGNPPAEKFDFTHRCDIPHPMI